MALRLAPGPMSRLQAWGAAPGLLLASLLFLHAPTLDQPLIRDDVQFFASLEAKPGEAGPWAGWRGLLRRCTAPVFYRPLAAPFLLAAYTLCPENPAPARLALVLLLGLAAWSVRGVAQELTRSPAAAWTAACLYSLSLIHWDTLAVLANIGQLAGHALFWRALHRLLAGPRREPPRRGVGLFLMTATASLLFKEDAVVLPLFALGAGWVQEWPGKTLKLVAKAGAAWAGAYLLLRLALPSSFLEGPSGWTLRWPTTGLEGLLRAVGGELRYLLPLPEGPSSLSSLAAEWSSRPLSVAAWAAAAAGLGAALGWQAWKRLRPDETPAGLRPLRRLLLASLAGSAAAYLPYFLFNEFTAVEVHRLALGLGSLALGASALARLKSARSPLALPAFLAAAGGLYLGAAASVRYPDPALPAFDNLRLARETRLLLAPLKAATSGRLRDGDAVSFEGFDSIQGTPTLFWLLENRRFILQQGDGAPPAPAGSSTWRVRWRPDKDPAELLIERRPAGESWRSVWRRS